MDLVNHLASRNRFLAEAKVVTERLNHLSRRILDLRKPPPGPYMLFHHLSTTHARVQEITLILRRLYDARTELLKVDVVEDFHRPKDWPGGVPYPEEFQEIARQGRELDQQIVLDFQTMLIFTGIALDDWTHLAAYILNAPNPTKYSFDKLAKDEGEGSLAAIWQRHRDDILWLDAMPRLYRNKMIVHREQPWQIGHTRSTYYLDWSFFTPMAVGWVTDERKAEIMEELRALARVIQSPAPASSHDAVYLLLDNIARFNREQRRKIYELALESGFKTPTFQQFGHRLLAFLDAATQQLAEIAEAAPQDINLGYPPTCRESQSGTN